MKTMIKIAKTELRTLFYSPIVWFLMIAFLVQCGLVYVNMLERFVGYQEAGGLNLSFVRNLTSHIFLDQEAFFDTVTEKLYLYIPLLTMGLISRETGGGSIRLLYSSPVKVWQIILGKYAAMMTYNLIMVAIAGIFMVTGAFHIRGIDSGLLLSATLSFYLLLCTYTAIGLFMSCLTTYQVVAAISTFVAIAALSYVGTLWQDIPFLRDLTYFLSLSGRAKTMMGGLITTKDVLYFILVSAMFLSFSYFKLKGGMESKSLAVKITRYTVVVVAVLLIGYVGSRPALTGYYDATADKIRTLTPNTQRIIHELGDAPLEVTVYNNVLNRFGFYGTPQFRNRYLATWERYLRFKPDISFNYVNYYDSTYDNSREDLDHYKGKSLEEITLQKMKARKMDIPQLKKPEEIRKIIDLKPELNRFVVQLRYKNKTTFLRVFDDMMTFPGETEVGAAFKRLQQARMPKIAFLSGELERSIHRSADRDYKVLNNEPTSRFALLNQGFDVDSLSAQTGDIPADISVLVVADPKINLSETSLTKIGQYIDKGGNLLIAGEPGKQAVLNPLLQKLGIQLMEGMIAQPSKELSPDMALPYLTSTAATFTGPVAKDWKDSIRISMPGVTGLTWNSSNGFTVKPLLMSDASQSWMKKGALVADSADVVFSPANGDQRTSVPLALSLNRQVNGKEQRIIVTGDADFISNIELTAQRGKLRTGNFTFCTSLFSWLCYGEFPIDTSRPEGKDNHLMITSDGVDVMRIFLLWGLPALLLLTGSTILIRRRRK